MINLKNDNDNSNFLLENYISNHVLNKEKIIAYLSINNYIYIFTHKRIIIFQKQSSLPKLSEIKSYFYDKISSINYYSYLVNLDRYALLKFNFLDSNQNLILNFPENIIFDIINIIDRLQ